MTEIKGVHKLYEAYPSYLRTIKTARYYGRGCGNVYVIYSTTYLTPTKRESRVKGHFAIVKDCKYDWKAKKVYRDGKQLHKTFDGYPDLDSPDIKIREINSKRNVQGIQLERLAKWFFENTKLPMMRTK